MVVLVRPECSPNGLIKVHERYIVTGTHSWQWNELHPVTGGAAFARSLRNACRPGRGSIWLARPATGCLPFLRRSRRGETSHIGRVREGDLMELRSSAPDRY